MNDLVPYKENGGNVTAQASDPVIGKRFLAITGDITPDGSLTVAHAPAGTRPVGVAKYDAATGSRVGVMRVPRAVVPVTAGTAIAAGAEVEVGAAGQAVPKAAGVAAGYVETSATAGQDARVCLY